MGCGTSKPDVVDDPIRTSPKIPSPAKDAALTPATNGTPRVQFAKQDIPQSSPQKRPYHINEIAEPPDLANRLQKVGTAPAKHGGFAEVWRGTLDGKTQVAIKCLRAVEVDGAPAYAVQTIERLDKRMRRELKVWMPVSEHHRILTCLGFATVNGMPSLISPWCENGNAQEYLTANPNCNRKKLVLQIAEGLAYLHGLEHPIVHHDIKLANILIADNGDALITDFGVAKVTDEYRTGLTTSGRNNQTTKYSAPEALEGTDRDPKSDVYSFGMLMLEVMSDAPVWDNLKNLVEIMNVKAKGGVPQPENHPGLPADDPLWHLLGRCWDSDPDQRPTMDEVVKELNKLGYGP